MIPMGLPRPLGMVLVLAAVAAAPLRALTPDWSANVSWTVATSYRKMQLGRSVSGASGDKAQWSDPSHWVFRVAQTEDRKSGRHYLVQVRNRASGPSSMASIVFAAFDLTGGHRALSLIEGKFMRWVRGNRVVTERVENSAGESPRPVLSEQSLIPYDFPAFPLVEPGAKTRKRTFEITEQLPPLAFAKDVVQTEQTGLDPAAFAGSDIERLSSLPRQPREKMVFVTLERAMDGAATRQIWVPGLPWPLFSDDGDSRSVLVTVSSRSAPASGRTTR